MTHHPLDHGKRPKDWEHTRRHKDASEATANSDKKTLLLSDPMKAALMTNGVSSEQAESLISSLNNQTSTNF